MLKTYEVILLLTKSSAYARGLFRGIVNYAHVHGPWRFHMEPEFYQRRKGQTEDWIDRIGADGIIAHMANAEITKRITRLGIPTIINNITKPTTNAHIVMSDNEAIGRLAGEYFLGNGFRHFAYCGFDEMHWSRRRSAGFCQRIAKAGFDVCIYKEPQKRNARTEENRRLILADWLRSLPKSTALLACNDDRAGQVLAACETAAVKVPEEIAVLGVDNDDFVCETTYPRLSSIQLSLEAAGYKAAALLEQLMTQAENPHDPTCIVIPPLFVLERESTNILMMDDHKVAEALRFVREHAKDIVLVNDVAENVGLSARALQRRFNVVLGRSVHEEIKRARVNEMARLLIETNLSITEIAHVFQCNEIRNISRYFRQLTGLSPSQYRKRHSTG